MTLDIAGEEQSAPFSISCVFFFFSSLSFPPPACTAEYTRLHHAPLTLSFSLFPSFSQSLSLMLTRPFPVQGTETRAAYLNIPTNTHPLHLTYTHTHTHTVAPFPSECSLHLSPSLPVCLISLPLSLTFSQSCAAAGRQLARGAGGGLGAGERDGRRG